eukprot:SAG11_NODE_5860_length_1446_cov_1.148478_3_plen_186_part_01
MPRRRHEASHHRCWRCSASRNVSTLSLCCGAQIKPTSLVTSVCTPHTHPPTRLQPHGARIQYEALVVKNSIRRKICRCCSGRLFNDGPTMLLLYAAVLLFAHRRWLPGCVLFSFAFAVRVHLVSCHPSVAAARQNLTGGAIADEDEHRSFRAGALCHTSCRDGTAAHRCAHRDVRCSAASHRLTFL